MNSLPLQDILVIDLTRVLSGPFCTMQLHHLGARVIKVEKPGTGDDTRMYPPFQDGEPMPFHAINSGKESVTLDIKNNAEDRKVFEALIKKADVLIENFTPGYMDSIGYGWDSVKLINPKLIYASISGFGHTGPRKNWACYDLVAQGMSGIMSITGHPEEKPVKVGTEVADMLAGLYATIGINAALYQRQTTGEGRYIDIAMLDGMASFMPSTLAITSATHKAPHATGNRHPLAAPFDVYFAKDAPISICVANNNLFRKLCEAMEHPEFADDERFNSNNARLKNVELMTEMLNKALAKQPAAHWLALFHQFGIPSGPINNMTQVLEDEQLLARNMLRPFADAFMKGALVLGNPVKMNGIQEPNVVPRGPKLGEHNEPILKELGF